MKRLIPFVAAATMALTGAVSAKTVTYVEIVTRADGSKVVMTTKVARPTDIMVRRVSLQRSLVRSMRR
ncbi:hypothetical protein BCF46_1144 [Litoreibacter meonggei]|uniref:YD repeat-containing protein n=1 Tax=Litoreibacter meonggei TaxID=1049199 RepID=A0A497WR00_9RHOB|nr:hypothetical protein [Litoreibacter meonggei]RLJ59002.1 hypothetical protein BCF46_1144 [Litoreibacter meonggei]